jgi:hypothetical protein
MKNLLKMSMFIAFVVGILLMFLIENKTIITNSDLAKIKRRTDTR